MKEGFKRNTIVEEHELSLSVLQRAKVRPTLNEPRVRIHVNELTPRETFLFQKIEKTYPFGYTAIIGKFQYFYFPKIVVKVPIRC